MNLDLIPSPTAFADKVQAMVDAQSTADEIAVLEAQVQALKEGAEAPESPAVEEEFITLSDEDEGESE